MYEEFLAALYISKLCKVIRIAINVVKQVSLKISLCMDDIYIIARPR